MNFKGADPTVSFFHKDDSLIGMLDLIPVSNQLGLNVFGLMQIRWSYSRILLRTCVFFFRGVAWAKGNFCTLSACACLASNTNSWTTG